MPSNVTLSVYIGSGAEGIENEKIILEAATKKGMGKSEFASYCIYEQLKREFNEELNLKTKPGDLD
jgi:hypothetical protein